MSFEIYDTETRNLLLDMQTLARCAQSDRRAGQRQGYDALHAVVCRGDMTLY